MLKKDMPTILIVDDIEVNLYILGELLNEYNIMTASNGPTAIEMAQKYLPDFILLDIIMPAMDGYEVCIKLKENELTKDIPVIFCTAQTDESSIDRAYQVGGIDYVTKPFKSKELLARIKTQVAYADVQKKLKEKLELLNKYVSFSSTDTAGNITEVSDAYCEISGYSREELIGKNHNIVRHPSADPETYKGLWETISNGDSWSGEIKNLSKSGYTFWVDVVITPILDHFGRIKGYSAIRQDISYQKKVEQLSITDQLTDLNNRRHFNDVFSIEIKRSIRNGLVLSFVMLDIDSFKHYNDTYGHQAGDIVLSKIGKLLNTELHRAEDTAYRLGGEEFGILFTARGIESSKSIVNRILIAVRELNIEHKNSEVSDVITISAGLACIDFSKEKNHKLSENDIYKMADEELYKSKSGGRDRLSYISL